MSRRFIVPIVITLAGCPGPSGFDGGSPDGGTTHGGTAMLTGSLAFTVVEVNTVGNALADGGFDNTFVKLVLADRALNDPCDLSTQSFHSLGFSIDNFDGGATPVGTYPIVIKDHGGFIGSYIGVLDPSFPHEELNFMAAITGNCTLTRFDDERVVGSFDASYVFVDGGVAGTLQGSFDAPKTACR